MSIPDLATKKSDLRWDERRGDLPVGMGAVPLLLAEFEDWLSQWQDDADRWAAFDRFIRSQLHEIVGAKRVRCYHVVRGGDVLEPLSAGNEPFSEPISARKGIYGYVLTRGHRYLRTDTLLGPAVHQLADQAPEATTWCFPISYEHGAQGLVSVGSVKPELASDRNLFESLGCVITLLWGRLIDREKMIRACQVDQGSGVLNRSRFFEEAERALADGYDNHEPSLAMALVLEGIRGLDDSGRWESRDQIVVCAGQAIRRKLRSDDIVGRFADDRFVVLMRRLDTSLGRMIVRKLVNDVQETLSGTGIDQGGVLVRCGLTGTGHKRPTLQDLLGKAFSAVVHARGADRILWDDLDEESNTRA
jgi:GGDEF domain-containing protein